METEFLDFVTFPHLRSYICELFGEFATKEFVFVGRYLSDFTATKTAVFTYFSWNIDAIALRK